MRATGFSGMLAGTVRQWGSGAKLSRRGVLLLAVGAPLIGPAVVVGLIVLEAYGPRIVADTPIGTVLMVVLGVGAFALLVVTQVRYRNVLVAFGFVAYVLGVLVTVRASEELVSPYGDESSGESAATALLGTGLVALYVVLRLRYEAGALPFGDITRVGGAVRIDWGTPATGPGRSPPRPRGARPGGGDGGRGGGPLVSPVALLLAVGAPVAGLASVIARVALEAFGPAVLASGLGEAVPVVLGFCGYAVLVATQMRYLTVLVGLGGMVALLVGAAGMSEAARYYAAHHRGETTACEVEMVYAGLWRTLEEGSPGPDRFTTTHHEYVLRCAAPQVRDMSTRSDTPVAETGETVEVVYDPSGRLAPVPAEPRGPSFPWSGAGLFVLGVALRVLNESGVPPFGGAVREGDRSWRTLWGLRRYRV